MKIKNEVTILAVAILVLLAATIGFSQCANTQTLKKGFQQFASPKQAKIWRNHARFALSTEDLNPAQREVVDDFLAAIKDDSYTATSDKSAIAAIAARAAVLFPDKAQLKRIFYTLTNEEMQGFSLVPASYRKPLLSADCSCNISYNVLCDSCIGRDAQSCNYADWGCGFGWVLPCNGNCHYNDMEIQ